MVDIVSEKNGCSVRLLVRCTVLCPLLKIKAGKMIQILMVTLSNPEPVKRQLKLLLRASNHCLQGQYITLFKSSNMHFIGVKVQKMLLRL